MEVTMANEPRLVQRIAPTDDLETSLLEVIDQQNLPGKAEPLPEIRTSKDGTIQVTGDIGSQAQKWMPLIILWNSRNTTILLILMGFWIAAATGTLEYFGEMLNVVFGNSSDSLTAAISFVALVFLGWLTFRKR